MLTLGCAYYPEDWDETMIEKDAERMRSVGMKVVRIGEFAWSHMERSDGVYSFEWLHKVFEIFRKNDLAILLGTPSAAAPPWLVRKHPEILHVDFFGRRAYPGVRQYTCCTSPVYRRYAARIVERMVSEFHGYPNLFAWQIDNELEINQVNCCCPACRTGFREYLKRKFKTLEAVNQAWKTTFWSSEYSDWEEIEIGDMDRNLNPSLVLESQRYRNQEYLAYVENQASIIRKGCPGIPIVTNNCGDPVDRHALFRRLSAAGGDLYVNPTHRLSSIAFWMDHLRGFRPGTLPWLLECSTTPWEPVKNLLELLMVHYHARGADLQLYFHWRSHSGGFEKSHGSFVGFCGTERPGLASFRKAAEHLLPVLRKFGDLPPPQCRAGILYDFDAQYNYSQGFRSRSAEYGARLRAFHEHLLAGGINSDLVPEDADFGTYSLLLIPVHPHISREFADRLKTYVRNGGVLLLGAESGLFDEESNFISGTGPEHLQELFGMEIRDFIRFRKSDFPDGCVTFSGRLGEKPVRSECDCWIASLHPRHAEVLCSFDSGVYQGQAVCTLHRFGKGAALYCGAASCDSDFERELLLYAASLAGLPIRKIPAETEIVSRGPLVFLLNYGTTGSRFELPLKGEVVLGSGFENGMVDLAPRQYCVIRRTGGSEL